MDVKKSYLQLDLFAHVSGAYAEAPERFAIDRALEWIGVSA